MWQIWTVYTILSTIGLVLCCLWLLSVPLSSFVQFSVIPLAPLILFVGK